MPRALLRPSTILLLWAAAGCAPSRTTGTMDGSMGDGGPEGPCSEAQPCTSGRRCYQGTCVPDYGTCCSDDECQDDTRCSAPREGGMCGICLAYGPGEFDPQCRKQGFAATEFLPPMEQCHWPPPGEAPPATQVLMTPVVIDLDGDRLPEIVFAPQPSSSGPARLVAIRGKDCTTIYDVAANLKEYTQLAVADLDGDKRPEIVGMLFDGLHGTGHKLAVFDGRTGAKLAESSVAYQQSGADNDCSAPALADIEGDGVPEIIAGGLMVRWNRAQMRLDTVWNKPVTGGTWGTFTLAEDLDGDGKMEIVSGNQIFDGLTGADRTPAVMAGMSGGYPAIGDLNQDGAPDLVLVQSQRGAGKVAVVDVRNNGFLMGPTAIPDGWGGTPTVADFDGDGKPDFSTAGLRTYDVFSMDCLAMPRPAKCSGAIPGVLWESPIKDSTGSTASSVFDFNGDGKAEVIYRDECWLRVYNGADGKVVFARAITSGTALEMPVVADVNDDGHADLIVPSDTILAADYCADQDPEPSTGQPHTGRTEGLFVLRDPMNRWVPSRPLWNQHTYHITNVNDDGSLPRSEMPNWKTFNNYRQNVQGMTGASIPQGDWTGKVEVPLDRGDCITTQRLYARMCNRGSAPVMAMVPGTFYREDPRMGSATPICTARTQRALQPGECETVSCLWNNPPQGPQDLWFRANDDGMDQRPDAECKNNNGIAFLPGVSCVETPG